MGNRRILCDSHATSARKTRKLLSIRWLSVKCCGFLLKTVKNEDATPLTLQAGTGLRVIGEEWKKLGYSTPVYTNDRAGGAFELFISGPDREVDMASDLTCIGRLFSLVPESARK